MLPHEEAGLTAIRNLFGSTVAYTGAGLNGGFVKAIKSDTAAEPYQGFAGTARRVTFEIAVADLPQKPANGNGIVEGSGASWKVRDASFHGDVASWVLTVEEA